MSRRSKGFLASVVVVLAILLVMLATIELLGRGIEPRLGEVLLGGLGAALLASLGAWMAVARISVPLRRLAETMSAMARTGDHGNTGDAPRPGDGLPSPLLAFH